jgi:hypothetical protein
MGLERVYCAVQTESLNIILAMAQTASRRPVLSEARFPFLVSQCEFCHGYSGTGAGIMQSVSFHQ